ncbi:MAG: RDD family protein [Chloroflexi bacterium]|nr:RDD family protein [Chloroflexota bacterium]
MTNEEGRRSAGSPGPRWSGDGEASRPPQADAPAVVEDSSDASRTLDGNEPTAARRIRPAPPPGFAEYATFWIRAVAWLIDEIAKTFIYFGILVVVSILTGSMPASSSGMDPVALAPRLLLSMGYDWLFWSQGWTPGALAMGIRIVRDDGSIPGPRAASMRVGGSLLSGASLLIGYVWMLWSPRRQTWHDSISRTFVVIAPREQQ